MDTGRTKTDFVLLGKLLEFAVLQGTAKAVDTSPFKSFAECSSGHSLCPELPLRNPAAVPSSGDLLVFSVLSLTKVGVGNKRID